MITLAFVSPFILLQEREFSDLEMYYSEDPIFYNSMWYEVYNQVGSAGYNCFVFILFTKGITGSAAVIQIFYDESARFIDRMSILYTDAVNIETYNNVEDEFSTIIYNLNNAVVNVVVFGSVIEEYGSICLSVSVVS